MLDIEKCLHLEETPSSASWQIAQRWRGWQYMTTKIFYWYGTCNSFLFLFYSADTSLLLVCNSSLQWPLSWTLQQLNYGPNIQHGHSHGLAKLQMHHDLTLNLLDSLMETLGEQLWNFSQKICPEFDTVELWQEQQVHLWWEVKRASANYQMPSS